jgi:hypothetical protein
MTHQHPMKLWWHLAHQLADVRITESVIDTKILKI